MLGNQWGLLLLRPFGAAASCCVYVRIVNIHLSEHLVGSTLAKHTIACAQASPHEMKIESIYYTRSITSWQSFSPIVIHTRLPSNSWSYYRREYTIIWALAPHALEKGFEGYGVSVPAMEEMSREPQWPAMSYVVPLLSHSPLHSASSISSTSSPPNSTSQQSSAYLAARQASNQHHHDMLISRHTYRQQA